MFHQIQINASQTHLEKVLRKKEKDEPVRIYKLKTIMYGTLCVLYLAQKTLQQLGIDEKEWKRLKIFDKN